MNNQPNKKSLRELALEGAKFVVIKIDETSYWDDEISKKGKKIEGIYLVDLTQPTNCCSFEVNYPSQFIKNFFQETKGFTEDEITELENLDGRDGDCMYLLDHSVYDIAKIYTKADDKDFDEAMENEASNPSVC
jgi:hypothetical protein